LATSQGSRAGARGLPPHGRGPTRRQRARYLTGFSRSPSTTPRRQAD
jgi:hypothetical protein